MELLVRRALSKRLAGWLSYTLSRSVRDARFLTLDGMAVRVHPVFRGDRAVQIPGDREQQSPNQNSANAWRCQKLRHKRPRKREKLRVQADKLRI
jgi:hypothetical protein